MTDEPEDDAQPPAEKPVGYANPPIEHRWPKGFCPNPKGRPKGKTIVKPVSPLNAFQRKLLEEASRELATIDGKPFTSVDKLLLQLRTSDRPEDRKLLLKLLQDAIQVDDAWWQSAVADCMAYKDHWSPIFKKRRLFGRRLPDQFPDPDDIVILSATRFTFTGPVTKQQAEDWAFFKDGREAFVSVAKEIIECAGLFRPLEVDRQQYLKVRRSYYRANRHLPTAFKKKHPLQFPAFEPPKEPPEWYRDDDE